MRPHPDACFDLQFCHGHHRNHNPQLVNNGNRTVTGLLISKLWVKTRTLRTGNRVTPTPQIPQSWNNVLFTFAGVGLDCSERVTSQWIFVLTLNRASALKVEDNEQNFLLRQIIVATIKRIGLESKRTACFDLQFCHCPLWNHNPQIVNTNNRATTGFLISKLWVKTRTLRTGNRVTPTPQIPQSWNNVLFTFAGEGLDCSERVTSQWIFVLTLNRASALTVEGSEQNFLLPQNIVAITKESV